MASEKKVVILQSYDGEQFEIDEEAASQSEMIKHMIEDDCAEGVIPLPNVSGNILALVVEYSKKHAEAEAAEEEYPTNEESATAAKEDLKTWDAEFAKVDRDTLYDLLHSANYLNNKSLLDLVCQTVADLIKGKMPEEIRETFNIENDFAPGQEEEYRSEYAWAFESVKNKNKKK